MDPTGAVIPNASIEVVSTETNALYPTVSTDTGAYTVPRLPPGSYSVTVTAAGFKKLTRTSVTVDAGQTLPLDLTLQVGSANESVTVSAEATLLKTESGDVVHNITLAQLDDLPILGIGTARTPAATASAILITRSCCFPASATFANFTMIVNGAPTNTAALPHRRSRQHQPHRGVRDSAEHAQRRRDSGDGDPDQQLRRGVWSGGRRSLQYHHEVRHQSVPRHRLRILRERRSERRRSLLVHSRGRQVPAAKSAQRLRRHVRRSGRASRKSITAETRHSSSTPTNNTRRRQGADFHRYLAQRAVSGRRLLRNLAQRRREFNPATRRSFNPDRHGCAGPPGFRQRDLRSLDQNHHGDRRRDRHIHSPITSFRHPAFSPVAVAIQKPVAPLCRTAAYTTITTATIWAQRITEHSFHQDRSGDRRQSRSWRSTTTTPIRAAQFTTPNGNADGSPRICLRARAVRSRSAARLPAQLRLHRHSHAAGACRRRLFDDLFL